MRWQALERGKTHERQQGLPDGLLHRYVNAQSALLIEVQVYCMRMEILKFSIHGHNGTPIVSPEQPLPLPLFQAKTNIAL
jgi:hypothetical protein